MKKIQTDKSFLVLIAAFLGIGIIMIYNSTVIYSEGLYGESNKLIFRHIAWIITGILGFLFLYRFNYKKLGNIIYFFLIPTYIPLALLAFLGVIRKIGISLCSTDFIFAPCVNGASRWIYFNPFPFPKIPFLGVLGFQPGEFAKLTLVLYLSYKLSKLNRKDIQAFYLFIVITFVTAFLVFMQPNMSTAVLIFMIGTLIYFSSGATLAPLFISFPVLGSITAFFMMASSYRRERILTFLGGYSGSGELGAGYHIKQVLIALGSGGLWGVGLGQSRQKFQYLPEVAADSIFAIIGEELGFLGTTLLIIMAAVFIYKGFRIAKNAPDTLGRLLAVGITSWFGLQFFINIAAMTKFIPLTGVPLPLISYGGSSTFFSLMGLGILGNISSQSDS